MFNLQFIEKDGKEYVITNDTVYLVVDDYRGVREKFWIVEVDRNGQIKENGKSKLFKYNRNEVSCENWGEIFANAVANEIGVDCVKYEQANLYSKNGELITTGVICDSYKENMNSLEYSGFSIQSRVANHLFDNFNGQTISNINTVVGFTECISDIFDGVLSEEEIQSIKNELTKQAIFDFVLAQTDRHWFNTTFLIDDVDGNLQVSKASAYDNGCCAYLKRKESSIEGMSKEIGKAGKDSPYLTNKLEQYCPMFGFSTSTVELDQKNLSKLIIPDAEKGREIFLTEICNEIATNPEIAIFFKSLVTRIQSKNFIPKILGKLAERGEEPPIYVTKMVKDVMEHQVDVINDFLHIMLNQLNDNEMKIGE